MVKIPSRKTLPRTNETGISFDWDRIKYVDFAGSLRPKTSLHGIRLLVWGRSGRAIHCKSSRPSAKAPVCCGLYVSIPSRGAGSGQLYFVLGSGERRIFIVVGW